MTLFPATTLYFRPLKAPEGKSRPDCTLRTWSANRKWIWLGEGGSSDRDVITTRLLTVAGALAKWWSWRDFRGRSGPTLSL